MSIHYTPNAWSYLPIKAGMSSNWNAINRLERDLLDQNVDVKCLIKGKLGKGDGIRFWVDWWIEDGPRMYKYPALFAIESNKSVTVANRLSVWEWKRSPNSPAETLQLQQCTDLLLGSELRLTEDKLGWAIASDGLFSVAACRSFLTRHAVPYYPFKWVKSVPKKVSIFGWRAVQDRLPMLVGLKKRKIIQSSTTCRLCGGGDEDSDHLLTSCFVANMIWNKVSV